MTADTPDLIQEFLGSAHIFSSAVSDVVEQRLLRKLAGDRLTWSQFKLLRLVAMTDAHTVGDVAVFLGVSDAAASKAVDKLVRRRLVHRAEDKEDRRAIHLSLTDQGRHLVEAYLRARDHEATGLFAGFPAGELRRAAQLLDRLSAALVDHGAAAEQVCLQCGIYFRDTCLVRQLVGRKCFYVRHTSKARATDAPKDRASGGRAD